MTAWLSDEVFTVTMLLILASSSASRPLWPAESTTGSSATTNPISGATSASHASISTRPVAAVAMTPAVVLARPGSSTTAASTSSVAMDVATPTNNKNEQLS